MLTSTAVASRLDSSAKQIVGLHRGTACVTLKHQDLTKLGTVTTIVTDQSEYFS